MTASVWQPGTNLPVMSPDISLVYANMTLNVPAQYPTIAAAYASLANLRFVKGAKCVIRVADGTYNFNTSLYLNHPNGAVISIIGNQANKSNCVIQCANSDAFYLPPGFIAGQIDGFDVVKTGARNNMGFVTDGGKFIQIGPNITVDNFYYGISARSGGWLNCDGPNVEVKNAGDVGIWAFLNSYVSCQNAKVTGSNDSANGLGGGIVAEFSSSIQANGAQCSGNYFCGFSAISGSSIRAWNVNSSGNGHGFVTGSGGRIECFGSTVGTNNYYAHYCPDSDGQVYGLLDGRSTLGAQGLGVEHTGLRFGTDGAMKVQSGSVTLDATQPGSVVGDSTYLDQNCKANGFNITRFLEAGVEQARIQYRNDFDGLEIIVNTQTIGRFFSGGKVALGRSNTQAADTTGFLQIPSVNGVPTGVITDTFNGYVSMVFNTADNKLYIFNPNGAAWHAAAFI